MSEQETGGASDEERAEAEKFNRMVDEGKLTPAEASQVEKDKTPEEVEAEKVAMEILINPFQEAVHYTYPEHIPNILKHGILSQTAGKEIGVKVPSQFFENERNIYFVKDPQAYQSSWGTVGIVIKQDEIQSQTNHSMDFLSMGVIPSLTGEVCSTPQTISRKSIRGIILVGETPLVRPEEIKNISEIAKQEKLPLFDRFGNLRWPKTMLPEQIDKYVAEREARKKEEKEEGQEE